MDAANRYLDEVYMPNHNAEFALPALEEGSAFVPYIGTRLPDILCAQFERVVENDNCVSFEGRKLQIPQSSTRAHYVKAQVRVHRYVDGTLALFHGPRKLATYDAQGNPFVQEMKQAA